MLKDEETRLREAWKSNNEMVLIEIVEPMSTVFPVGSTAWLKLKENSKEFNLLSLDKQWSQEFHPAYFASIEKIKKDNNPNIG